MDILNKFLDEDLYQKRNTVLLLLIDDTYSNDLNELDGLNDLTNFDGSHRI